LKGEKVYLTSGIKRHLVITRQLKQALEKSNEQIKALETAHKELLYKSAKAPEPEFNDVFATTTDLTNLSAVRVLTTKVLTSEHTVSKITQIMEGMMTNKVTKDQIVNVK
jgi:hypothetical protein